MHIPPGYAMFIPVAFRKAVDLPVVGVGRFKDPLQAERALAEGHCDLVGVVRGQIADPDFAAKARAGATDEIRLCLQLQPGVRRPHGPEPLARLHREPAHRPRGRTRVPCGIDAASPKKVMVVGAGPAGLQAAIAAARNGHQVTVCEKEAAGRRPGAPRGQRAQPRRVRRHDPQPAHRVPPPRRRPSSTASACGPGSIEERKPDHVIVATGAEPQPPVVGARRRRRNVADVREVLDGMQPNRSAHVVVVDEIGFHHATSVAELLADRGCTVEIVTPGMVVGQDLGITLDMENWWMRAGAKGIVQTTDLVPMGLAGGELTLLHHPTGANQTRHPDWVVLAVPPNPVEWLYHDLQGRRRQRAAGRRLRGPAACPRRRRRRRTRWAPQLC